MSYNPSIGGKIMKNTTYNESIYKEKIKDINNEIYDLAERMYDYEKFAKVAKAKFDRDPEDNEDIKKLGGTKRGINAKTNQLELIYIMIHYEREKKQLLTGFFVKKLTTAIFGKTINNNNLFVYFSCKQNIKLYTKIKLTEYIEKDKNLINSCAKEATKKFSEQLEIKKKQVIKDKQEAEKKAIAKKFRPLSE